MKKLIGFIIIVAALMLGSYYGMGVLTERAIKKNIDVLNQTNGVNVTLSSYHRGLFRSHATLNWKLRVTGSPANALPQTILVNMPLTVSHGPIMVSHGQLRFGLGNASSEIDLPINNKLFKPTGATKPTLKLSVFVSYFNRTSIEIMVLPFRLSNDNASQQIDFKGIKADFHISATHKQLKGEFLAEGLSWRHDKATGAFDSIQSNYNLNLSRSGLSLGDATISIPSMSIREEGKEVLGLKAMNVHSKSGVVKGLFSSSMKADIAELSFNQKKYTACQLTLDIHHLDAAALAKLNQNMALLNQSSQRQKQQAIFMILADLPYLLSKGAALDLSDFMVTTPSGQIMANAKIIFPNEMVSNPFQLIQKIKGSGKLTISAATLTEIIQDALKRKAETALTNQGAPITSNWTAEAEQKINRLIQAGVLVLDKDAYQLAFEYVNGTLKINGRDFNPGMLSGLN